VPRLQKCKTRRGEGRAASSGRRILRGGSPISKGPLTVRAARRPGARSSAVINEQDKVDRAGEATWCVALRPVVEKYKDGLFEPVR
jgi:hypothetical protein